MCNAVFLTQARPKPSMFHISLLKAGPDAVLTMCTLFVIDNGSDLLFHLSPLPHFFSLVIHLTCLQWNPALPDTLAVSLSNELQLLVVKDDVVATVTKKLPANASE